MKSKLYKTCEMVLLWDVDFAIQIVKYADYNPWSSSLYKN